MYPLLNSPHTTLWGLTGDMSLDGDPLFCLPDMAFDSVVVSEVPSAHLSSNPLYGDILKQKGYSQPVCVWLLWGFCRVGHVAARFSWLSALFCRLT